MKVICYWNVIVFATISIKLMSKEISQENFNLILDQFLARDFLLTFNIKLFYLYKKIKRQRGDIKKWWLYYFNPLGTSVALT